VNKKEYEHVSRPSYDKGNYADPKAKENPIPHR